MNFNVVNTKFLPQAQSLSQSLSFAAFRQSWILPCLLLCVCVLGVPNKSSATGQLRQDLNTALKIFMTEEQDRLRDNDQGDLLYTVRGLDPRLTLQPCETPLDLSPMDSNWLKKRSHLKVSCQAPLWSFIIGLELALMREVLVARSPISRLEPLDSMVEFAQRDILSIQSGYIDSMAGILGKVTKRNLVIGQVISPHLIKAQILVPRNAVVEVSAQIGSIAITSEGVALENGAFGEMIRVRNKRSKRVIEARVINEGKVEVLL